MRDYRRDRFFRVGRSKNLQVVVRRQLKGFERALAAGAHQGSPPGSRPAGSTASRKNVLHDRRSRWSRRLRKKLRASTRTRAALVEGPAVSRPSGAGTMAGRTWPGLRWCAFADRRRILRDHVSGADNVGYANRPPDQAECFARVRKGNPGAQAEDRAPDNLRAASRLANALAAYEEGVRTSTVHGRSGAGCTFAPAPGGNVITEGNLGIMFGKHGGVPTGIDLDQADGRGAQSSFWSRRFRRNRGRNTWLWAGVPRDSRVRLMAYFVVRVLHTW